MVKHDKTPNVELVDDICKGALMCSTAAAHAMLADVHVISAASLACCCAAALHHTLLLMTPDTEEGKPCVLMCCAQHLAPLKETLHNNAEKGLM
jgi:hypothetical protein